MSHHCLYVKSLVEVQGVETCSYFTTPVVYCTMTLTYYYCIAKNHP